MNYMWLKYRFERVSEDGDGAYFTKLPNLLFFNVSRTAHQGGGNEIFETEDRCRDFVKRARDEEAKDAVSEYTGQQMEIALRAIDEHRRLCARSK